MGSSPIQKFQLTKPAVDLHHLPHQLRRHLAPRTIASHALMKVARPPIELFLQVPSWRTGPCFASGGVELERGGAEEGRRGCGG